MKGSKTPGCVSVSSPISGRQIYSNLRNYVTLVEVLFKSCTSYIIGVARPAALNVSIAFHLHPINRSVGRYYIYPEGNSNSTQVTKPLLGNK